MIVLGAVLVAMGVATALSSHVQIVIAGQSSAGSEARELAMACLEEAVHRLKIDPAYVGGTVPLGAYSCAVTVTGSNPTRTVTAVASIDGFTKTIVITLNTRQNAAANAKGWALTAWSESDPP